MQGKIYFHPHPCPLPSRERAIGVFSSQGEGEKVILISGRGRTGNSHRGESTSLLPPPLRGRIEVGAREREKGLVLAYF